MIVALAACADVADIVVTSDAFEADGPIPVEHTCDGADVSPPLAWTGVPAEAATLAMVVDDPDAPGGTTVHWLWWDLEAAATGLAADVAADDPPFVQGTSDMGPPGWLGPCPPPGDAHRYVFTLYAVDGLVGLPVGADRDALDDALRGRILGEGALVGTYERR